MAAVAHSPRGYVERPRPSGLADVLEIILDKGIVIVAEDLLLDALERALGLGLRAAGRHRLHQLGETLGVVGLGEVKAVDGLRKAQVGVHAGHHDPRVDGQDLDPDQ